MSTVVPAEVPWPRASRHLLPYTRNSPAVLGPKVWFGLPLQSHNSAAAPLACEAPVMSRHRPDWLPVMRPAGRLTAPVLVSMPQELCQLKTTVPVLVSVIGSQTGSDALRLDGFHRSPKYR